MARVFADGASLAVQAGTLFHWFIPRKIHGTYIQAGGHKLTNWREGSYEALYNMLMNINQMAICLTAGRSDGSALMVIGVSNVIPRHGWCLSTGSLSRVSLTETPL